MSSNFMEAQRQGRETTRLEYGRYGNPTLAVVERKLADLDGGEAALLFSSGMAAVTVSLFALLSAGSHVILTDDSYRRTRQFIAEFLTRYQVEATVAPLGDCEALEAVIRPDTRLIFSETPTNPRLRVVDMPRLVEIARRHGLLTVIEGFVRLNFGCPRATLAEALERIGTGSTHLKHTQNETGAVGAG